MKVRGYHNTRAVTFNMQDRLDDKIDKPLSMMSKLTAQDSNNINSSSIEYIKEKRGHRQRITMTKVNIRPDTDQTVLIEECHLEVELGMDRIIQNYTGRLQYTENIEMI